MHTTMCAKHLFPFMAMVIVLAYITAVAATGGSSRRELRQEADTEAALPAGTAVAQQPVFESAPMQTGSGKLPAQPVVEGMTAQPVTEQAAEPDVQAKGVYAVPVSPRMPLQVDSGTGINSQSVAAAGQPVPMKSVHLTYYVHASQAVSAATVTPATTCAYIVGGTCPTGIEYNEGPIMRGPLELVPIFYGTSWTARQMSIIRMFLSGLGGSTWMAVNAAYGDNTQWGANNRMMNSTLSYNFNTLSNKLPQGRNLSDSAVWSLVTTAITNMRVAPRANAIYLLLTAPEIATKSGFCTKYCGWHTWDVLKSVPVKYAFVGNSARCPSACISPDQHLTATNTPNGDVGIDAMLSVLAHEITETASDPEQTAWFNSDHYENADKCAWKFGTISKNPAGKIYNVQLTNGMFCLLQQNWYPFTGAVKGGPPGNTAARTAGCYTR